MGLDKKYAGVTSRRFETRRLVFHIMNDSDDGFSTAEKKYDHDVSFNPGKIGKHTRVDGVRYAIADVFEEGDSLVMILESPERFEERMRVELAERAAREEQEKTEEAGKPKTAEPERKEWEDDDAPDDSYGVSDEYNAFEEPPVEADGSESSPPEV